MKNNTFWNLITNQGIEIPPIQRDYAQGRTTGKIPSIRAKFISSIFEALDTEKPLGLDFIYGKIFGLRNEEEFRRNKNAVEALLKSIKDYAGSIDLTLSDFKIEEKNNDVGSVIYLVPLDGQQRLTTLFLIHWYIFSQLKKEHELSKLLNFRYKTRKSSENFIQLLCHSNPLEYKEDLKEEISNLENFSNTWLEDPTVVSMLNVIQEIHNYCQSYNEEQFSKMFHNLLNEEMVYFDFLNLQDFNLSDDLYVKMNARGKQLSDFENFKAWLFSKIENENWYEKELWINDSEKFDIEWNDVFWNAKNTNDFDIDEVYLYYFKLCFLSNFISDYDAKKDSLIRKNAAEYYKEAEAVEQLISNTNEFDFEKFFDQPDFHNNLNTYFTFLDFCRVEKDGSNNIALLDEMLRESFEYYFKSEAKEEESVCFSQYYFSNKILGSNWWQKLYFFAIQRYLLMKGKTMVSYSETDVQNLKDFNRIISNLIFNTYVDSPDDFSNYLNTIEKLLALLDFENSIYKQAELISKTSFVSVQKDDEIIKCRLIIEDYAWEKLLIQAEQHPYFYGQVKFLIELSNKDIYQFKILYEKIAPLFMAETLNNPNSIMQRALLTNGNYFLEKRGDKLSFCKNTFGTVRERNENWRQTFYNHTTRNLIKLLIINPDYDAKNIENSLNKIIETYILKENVEEIVISDLEYHKLYIFCPKLFNYGDSRLIQLFDKKFAYQLNSSMTVGYFNELITAYIKNRYYLDNDRIKYEYVKGWNNDPTIKIDEKITCKLDTQTQRIIFEGLVAKKEANTIHEAITIINQILSL